jgi:hypothetical protein
MNINERDKDGNTALIQSIRYKHWEVAKMLMRQGADVNVYDKFYGKTPIMFLCEYSPFILNNKTTMDLVEMILDKGIDIKHKDRYNKDIFETMAIYGRIDWIKLFKEHGYENPWNINEKFIYPTQAISSAKTSINKIKIPQLFSLVDFEPGTVNLDVGGGKFDTATIALAKKGVENLIFDPYNRSHDHNIEVEKRLDKNKADTATLSNVLNVIKEKQDRIIALKNAYNNVKKGGVVWIKVYKSTNREKYNEKLDSYQLGWDTEEYIPEVIAVFGNAQKISNEIIKAIR